MQCELHAEAVWSGFLQAFPCFSGTASRTAHSTNGSSNHDECAISNG